MVVEKVFAVIAESTRRDLLEALAQESKSVGQLVDELGVSQPTVSKHLRVLREAGVVTMRAQGQKRFYGINTEPLALVSTWLESLGAGIGDGSGSGVAPAAAAPAAASLAAAPGTPAGVAPANGAGAVNGSGVAPAKPRLVVPAAAVAAPAAVASSAPVAPLGNAGATATPGSAQPAAVRQSAPTPAAAKAPAAAVATPAVSVPAAPGKPGAAVAVPDQAATLVVPQLVQWNENDGSVPGQFSRSVGRAANKAADLLANLPALPTFKRRKN